jgi:hypothetical protein
MSEALHQLQWRGRMMGPWALARIREALSNGEVHSLYQIHVEGRWLLLRDHLEALDAVELELKAASLGESRRRQEATKLETMIMAGQRHPGLASKPNPFGRPPPVFVKQASMHAASEALLEGSQQPQEDAPTCWLAVAAFVVACMGFVPYLNLVCWLPGIVLGHLALRRIRHNPLLEGRGLALGAVIMGYALLVFALLTAILDPALFQRVFPIRDV